MQSRQARQLVAESQKASTSWLQRQLRIGYNSAARLIERMEKEGLVSKPDHVGRREVRSEEHTSELQSLMRISYAVFCLKKKNHLHTTLSHPHYIHTTYLRSPS